MERVKLHSSSTGPVDDPPLSLPSTIPEIDSELVEAACRKSPRARRLHARLQAREESGKPMSEAEVEKMVKAATGPDGKPDGEQAIVIAEHAQRSPRTFRGGHGFLLRFLGRVIWQALLTTLRAFLADIKEAETEQRKRDELKKDLEKDRLDLETRRATLLRMDRARAEAPPRDPELDAQNRLRLAQERMKRT
jgi:hypothetical protein